MPGDTQSTIEYISTKEAAQALGFTVQHTRLLIRQGKLRGVKIGRDWLVEKKPLEKLLLQRIAKSI